MIHKERLRIECPQCGSDIEYLHRYGGILITNADFIRLLESMGLDEIYRALKEIQEHDEFRPEEIGLDNQPAELPSNGSDNAVDSEPE